MDDRECSLSTSDKIRLVVSSCNRNCGSIVTCHTQGVCGEMGQKREMVLWLPWLVVPRGLKWMGTGQYWTGKRGTWLMEGTCGDDDDM